MKIWLATIGEPLPVQGGAQDRLHRTGYLARFLAKHGHDVTWWTSTFDHVRKRHWFSDDASVQDGPRLKIELLHGRGYRSNVSLARFRDHREIGAKFAQRIRQVDAVPEIIVAALPTIELCAESVAYGRQFQVPVVLDMRDMWPDIFVNVAPRPLRPLARRLLRPLFRAAREACAGATAITGITDAFVNWGLERGNRQRTALDRSFAMGYASTAPEPDAVRQAEAFWDRQGLTGDGSQWLACFFGTFGRQFDLDTVLEAARETERRGKPIRWVLCGSGDRLEHYRQRSRGLGNVVLPGWVDAAAIYVLMRRAKVGLDPLPARFDFLATINNKAIEYLSASLPIVSSPAAGVLAELLSREQCGRSYAQGDAIGLADLLSRLYDDTAERQRLAANAGRVFGNCFRAENVYGDMMAYFGTVVESWQRHSRPTRTAA
jgi:glycosyltransferase involved in cell wall biosynthesis